MDSIWKTNLNTLELGVMKQMLIFDFDGVLARSLDVMLSCARQACLDLGFSCSPSKQDLEVLERMEFSEFGLQLGIPQEAIEAFVSRSLDLFSSRSEQLEIVPGMDQAIRILSRYAALSIVTGNSCQVVSKFLEAHQLSHEFGTILCAEDDGSREDKILSILSQHQGLKASGFMIGDAVSDIRAARNVGIKSIAVAWGHQSRGKLVAENPDFITDTPGELLRLFFSEGQFMEL